MNRKENIRLSLIAYLDQQEISQNEFAKMSGVPANYLSFIINGKTHIPVNGKDVEISQKYYNLIAEKLGISEKKEYWKNINTVQASQIISTLEDAKDYGTTNIIIGETGCGKSFITDLFIKNDPRNSFKVTVGSMDTIGDLVDRVCEVMNLKVHGSKSRKIREIVTGLKRLSLNERKPILIFDEAEYMKQATLCNIKELHDHLNKHCGLVLIGTDQLDKKLDKLKKANKDGMPQFYRRVKFGIRRLKEIDTTFKDFFNELEIKDTQLRRFLSRECDNYGELHDALVPAMREADRLGQPLNENLLRMVLQMPKI